MRDMRFWMGAFLVAMMGDVGQAQMKDYPLQAAPVKSVKVDGGFWGERLDVNRNITLPHVIKQVENAGEIDNYSKAAGVMPGEFKGWPARDSDAYKFTEGASYMLMAAPDEKMVAYLDGVIAKIAAAQEADGYLYTVRRIMPPEKMPAMSGKERWVNEKESHELYVMGLVMEAGVAYYQATGKKALLDVAVKCGDLMVKTFGPAEGQLHVPPGHEETELALVKLYRATGEDKYLKMSQYFVDQRGRHLPSWGTYAQDQKPVVEQSDAVGHAVRAGYLYAGVTDIAALTGEAKYSDALDRIWKSVTEKRMYLTGGLGARRNGEAFGNDYELPNLTAYNETCGAVANVFWNERMFLLHADAKYADVMERTLYNGVLGGVSLSGDRFFYTNVMESDGSRAKSVRVAWFTTPCCPTNIVRILPQVGSYAYATDVGGVYVNLFMAGSAELKVGGKSVRIEQETKYPWEGRVKMTLTPAEAAGADFALRVRVPGWARGEPVSGDLYRYAEKEGAGGAVKMMVNGTAVATDKGSLEKGYVVMKRAWKAGDVVELELPMGVHRVVANEGIEGNRGRVALERGPLVYCAEGVDNGGHARNLVLPGGAAGELTSAFKPELLGGVVVIQGKGLAVSRDGAGAESSSPVTVTAVPYNVWANRDQGEMVVWMATEPGRAVPATRGAGE